MQKLLSLRVLRHLATPLRFVKTPVTPFRAIQTVRKTKKMEAPIDVDALRAQVVQQGAIVRQLKKDGAGQAELSKGTSPLCCSSL